MRWVSEEVVERWLKGAYGIVVGHCSSCHGDDIKYLPEYDLGKNRAVMSCCGLSTALVVMEWKEKS